MPKLSLNKLVQLATTEKLRIVEGIDYEEDGVPCDGRSADVALHREIVGQALHKYAVRNGQILYGKCVIGVSPGGLYMSGLRATDNVVFRNLIHKLCCEVMHDFQALVMERWEEARKRKGVVRAQGPDERDKFTKQRFTGFT